MDSTAPKSDFISTKFYHILFDDPLVNPAPKIVAEAYTVAIPLGANGKPDVARQKPGSGTSEYEGGRTVVKLLGEQTAIEIFDSNGAARVVDLHLTDQPDYVECNRIADDSVVVWIFHRDPTSGSKSGNPYFAHLFDKSHTDEIRIHMAGGDDYAIVRGNVESSPSIRIIGGEGSDEMVDSSHIAGKFLFFTKDAKRTYFYGEPSETNFIYSSSTVLNSEVYSERDSLRDWGSEFYYGPWLRGSTDQGAFIGARVAFANYDFRDNPFERLISLRAGFATGPSKYIVDIEQLFPHQLGGQFHFGLRASSLDVLNFFGYGNTTSVDQNKYASAGYQLDQQRYELSGEYRNISIEQTSLWGSASLRYSTTATDPIKDSSIIAKRYEYGIGKMTTLRLGIGGSYDSRDDLFAPSKGIFANFGSYWTPEVINNSFAYTKLQADIRAYLSVDILTPITFALRMRADKIFGEHPFFEGCRLGSVDGLRGYYQDRFAGEESILGSVELRVKLADFSLLVPQTFGLFLFSDVGRVHVDNDFSNVWHSSFGGGLSLAPVSTTFTVTLTLARSPESTLIYLGSGFAF